MVPRSPFYAPSWSVTELWSVMGGAEFINRSPQAGADIITSSLLFPLRKGLASIFRINLFCIVNQPLRSTIYSTDRAAGSWPLKPILKTLSIPSPPSYLRRHSFPAIPVRAPSFRYCRRGPISIPRPWAARPYPRRVLPSISAWYTFARVNIFENFRG